MRLSISSKNTESKLELQESLCRNYATNNYPEFDVRIYKDTASGTNQEQLDEMMSDIKFNKIEAVIVSSLDRLSRSPKDLLNLIQLMEEHSCTLIAMDNPVVYKDLLQNIAAMSELEKLNQDMKLPNEIMTPEETLQLPIETKLDIKNLTKWPDEAVFHDNNLKLFYVVHCVVSDDDSNIMEEYDVTLDSIKEFDEWGWKKIIEDDKLLKTMKLINIVIKIKR